MKKLICIFVIIVCCNIQTESFTPPQNEKTTKVGTIFEEIHKLNYIGMWLIIGGSVTHRSIIYILSDSTFYTLRNKKKEEIYSIPIITIENEDFEKLYSKLLVTDYTCEELAHRTLAHRTLDIHCYTPDTHNKRLQFDLEKNYDNLINTFTPFIKNEEDLEWLKSFLDKRRL